MADMTAYPGGMPGANFGGTQQAVPTAGGQNTPAIGGQTNPFSPSIPNGGTQPGQASPYAGAPTPTSIAAYPNGQNPNQSADVTALSGLNPATAGGLYNQVPGKGGNNPGNLQFALAQRGFPQGVANALVNFLQSGAGYNPQVVQSLMDSLKPQVQQGEANIMEQFSSAGLRNSSSAQYGLATFESQVQDYYQQTLSQMYEQSVQNYMNVLMGGQAYTQPSPLQQFGQVAGGISSLLSGIGALKTKT